MKNRKRNGVILALAVGACAVSAIPSFAAETRAEYRTEAEPLQTELSALNEEIEGLQSEIKEISEKYRALVKAYREDGENTVSAETMAKLRALRETLPDADSYRTDESSVKTLREQAREARESENYDEALSVLNEILERKEKRLSSLQTALPVWKEIGALMSE